MTVTAAVEIKGLSCQSGHRFLLEDIDWVVAPGERWVVFGENGSGKTTLLSIIAGFKQQTAGEVRIMGKPYDEENILISRQTIGWVSSSFFDRYYHQESALDIVLAGKSGTFSVDRGLTDEDIMWSKKLLRAFQVEDKRNRPFNTLSKGERQRVLIARALFAKPKLLLLDEPSAGLDIYARAHLLTVLQQLAENIQLTIIYVTHYVDELLPEVFDQALFLQKGRIFAKGSVQTLFSQAVMSQFLDYPIRIQEAENGLRLTLEVSSEIGRIMEEAVR